MGCGCGGSKFSPPEERAVSKRQQARTVERKTVPNTRNVWRGSGQGPKPKEA